MLGLAVLPARGTVAAIRGLGFTGARRISSDGSVIVGTQEGRIPGPGFFWSDATGLPIEVLNYSVENKISVFDRDIAPTKETVDAYTKFLKDAGILKPDDNPKYDASFALKALKG